jgi:organic radical activating enzyme
MTAAITTLRVAEVFGPTFQGEGPSAGTPAMFIRLWGCNLDCGWCDTPYTWDTTGRLGVAYDRATESTDITVDDLVDRMEDVPLVVITGGEPLLQSSALTVLIFELVEAGYQVEVETNGTRPPLDPLVPVDYRISPKLDHARTTRQAIDPDRLALYSDRAGAVLKFVAVTPTDVSAAASVATAAGFEPDRVWIMPEGRTASAVTRTSRAIATATLEHGFNLTTRLHVLLWDDQRGV